MFVADQNATDRSQVKFFRYHSSAQEIDFFQSDVGANGKYIQMV